MVVITRKFHIGKLATRDLFKAWWRRERIILSSKENHSYLMLQTMNESREVMIHIVPRPDLPKLHRKKLLAEHGLHMLKTKKRGAFDYVKFPISDRHTRASIRTK